MGRYTTSMPHRSLPRRMNTTHSVASLLAFPIFGQSSHGVYGATVTLGNRDVIPRIASAGSGLQLRGSFRFFPAGLFDSAEITEFPFPASSSTDNAETTEHCERTVRLQVECIERRRQSQPIHLERLHTCSKRSNRLLKKAASTEVDAFLSAKPFGFCRKSSRPAERGMA